MKKRSFLEGFAAVPHIVWVLLFVVAPLIFVVYFAFTDTYGNFTFNNITMLSSYSHIFLLSVCFPLLATARILHFATFADEAEGNGRAPHASHVDKPAHTHIFAHGTAR